VRRVHGVRGAGHPSALAVALALVATATVAGCASPAPNGALEGAASAGTTRPAVAAGGTSAPAAPATSTTFVATTAVPPAPLRAVEPATCAFPVGAAQVPQPQPSSSTTTTGPKPDGTTPPPVDARAALARFSADPRVAGTTRSVSVWIDGLGEVAENPDQQLIVASNQKLLTALGVVRLLDPDERLHTDVIATGPTTDGVVHGDLVVVGGGDPTLTRTGPHSLETLVDAIAAAGIRRVEGRLLVDDSRYDDQLSVEGWADDWPRWVGPLAAFSADHNSYRKDADYLRDPALGNAELLRFALTARGVEVTGGVARGQAESGLRVASIESATITEMVTVMLFRSDNFIAEMLVKELGYRRTAASPGHRGTTTDGLAAIRDVTSQMCTDLGGVDKDGSGFSTADRHSARELRRLLLAAQLQPWGPSFTSTISLAGQIDALGGRLDGPRTAGNVRAKGGSLSAAKTFSGYLTTASGRNVVFSILVNNGNLAKAEDAIDDFVTNLASLRT
jgi:D-alanyl-D-alanine carboxypeptidase/D-alanyl-D-alanine-endopeptidase (penicillin-binding protein 4)